jgi:hypothetical protein
VSDVDIRTRNFLSRSTRNARATAARTEEFAIRGLQLRAREAVV